MSQSASDVYVKVRAGEEMYALPIAGVLEVAELGDLTALPGAGSGVLGVRNFHGRVLPVFDLALALGIRLPAPSRLVVADSGGCIAGFAVDDVTDVGPLPDGRAEPESEFSSEAVLADGALVGVVRFDRLFAALGSDVA